MSFIASKQSVGKAPCYRDPSNGDWCVSNKTIESGILKTKMKKVYVANDPEEILRSMPDCHLILGYPWIALEVLEN